jgi:hypothetical protein
MPTQPEEVVIDSDRVEPENLGERIAQGLLKLQRRPMKFGCSLSRVVGGSCGRVCRWGSAGVYRGPGWPRGSCGRGGDVTGQLLAAGGSSRAVTAARATPGQAASTASTSPGSIEPADLDLVIGAPGEHQLPADRHWAQAPTARSASSGLTRARCGSTVGAWTRPMKPNGPSPITRFPWLPLLRIPALLPIPVLPRCIDCSLYIGSHARLRIHCS